MIFSSRRAVSYDNNYVIEEAVVIKWFTFFLFKLDMCEIEIWKYIETDFQSVIKFHKSSKH